MIRYYTLDADNQPVRVRDLDAWAHWFENSGDRRVVARTIVGTLAVSTVFLGIDHRFIGKGPPLLFETMVFGGDDDMMRRYSTWDDAEAGHNVLVKQLGARVKT